ncbi:hypothetical protein IP90_01641 [Luteimonas cucumeris]|uniref:LVIVD repeat-containing protein n=1 Tax=Luteimonas cucumeris TaxID=985012 RepID=A0A562L8A9_9GAMM|nr:hypothetical protein [Luteimonas cucumeris]TWI03825.1 hypothetical protein IP90_01641 [Luteimonas cucumeris]
MSPQLLTVALLSALALSPALHATPAQAAAGKDRTLELSLIRGGAVSAEPIVDGRYVHIPTGRVLATWNYAQPSAPLRIATTEPADGAINSLVRRGDYLYASWRGHDGTSGVATYSLADQDRPVLVAQDTDYVDSKEKFVIGIAVANDHLYLFDNNHGVFVSNLADPAKPSFVRSAIESTPTQYTRLVTHGNVIHATGRSWIGGTVLHLYDVSNPDAPYRMAEHLVDGLDSFSLTPEPGLAIGIGNQLSLFDLSNPMQMIKRGWLDVPPATHGLRVGTHYYSFGYSDGVDIWNIADIDAPSAAGHLDISTLGGRHAVTLGKTVLLQTDTDLMQSLDVSAPAKPRHVATSWLPGGVGARDVAPLFHDRTLLLLQPNYGLMLSDSRTLAPLSRFEADLPAYLQSRSFEQLSLVGDTAYVVAWGYGLINVDLSDPRQPVELGRLPFPFAAVLDVKDDYAYIAKWTNGGLFGVADVSDPTKPRLVWQGGLSAQPYRLKVDKGHAFLVESAEPNSDTGGLRIYNLNDPAQPVEVAHLNKGCGNAFDLSIDSEVSLAYVACASGMQVIDISKPEAPMLIGHYESGESSGFNKVAQRRDRAWFADNNGLHELDVSDPTSPRLLKQTELGHQVPQRMQALADGRLVVLGGETGVHVFSRTKGRPSGTPRADGRLDP